MAISEYFFDQLRSPKVVDAGDKFVHAFWYEVKVHRAPRHIALQFQV